MNIGSRVKDRRLWLLALVCLATSWAPAVAQKTAKVWHIGLCHVGLDHEPPGLHTLHKALNDMGYVDGRNLNFD